MGAIHEYSTEFPKRTLRLLKSFHDKKMDYTLNVTFLMNCLLGLIVTAVENSGRKGLLAENVDEALLDLLPEQVELKVGKNILQHYPKAILKTRGKLSILRKIRNGIAHQNVEPVNDGNNWVGVTVWNELPNNDIDFRVTLTTAQLNSLASHIAQHYLKATK